MNAFERKMAEQTALITTLAMDINRLSDNFSVEVEFRGNVNALVIRVNDLKTKVYPKILGKLRVYYILILETYIDPEYQEYPFQDCCTIEQIVDVLHQIRQALIEGRNHDEHYPATDTEHTATTGMDERNGAHGAFLTEPAGLCHGSVERTGGQPAGSVSTAL